MICCSPLCVFRPPFPVPGPTLGSFWVPLGSPWTTLGRFGLPWGSPWSTKGDIIRFGQNWTWNSELIALKCIACAQKVTSQGSSAASADPPEVARGPQLPTPLHSRPGLRQREFRQTPSNNISCFIYVVLYIPIKLLVLLSGGQGVDVEEWLLLLC